MTAASAFPFIPSSPYPPASSIIGRLPTETLQSIFQYCKYDRKTLHAILFVNRNWCNIAVVILYARPFKWDSFGPACKSLLSTLLSSIHDDQTLTFDYISLISELRLTELRRFCSACFNNCLLPEGMQIVNMAGLINVLVEGIMNKCADRITKQRIFECDYAITSETLRSCMERIKELDELTVRHIEEPLLNYLLRFCRLTSLTIDLTIMDMSNSNIIPLLCMLIQSQSKGLHSFRLYADDTISSDTTHPLFTTLLSHHSTTLQHLYLHDLTVWEDLHRLASVPHLMTLEFHDCFQLSDNLLEPILSRYALTQFTCTGSSCAITHQTIQRLVQKSATQLLSLDLSHTLNTLTRSTLEELIKNCPNLEHLHLNYADISIPEAQSLANLRNLKTLFLHDPVEAANTIPNVAADVFLKIIAACEHLEAFGIEEWPIKEQVLDEARRLRPGVDVLDTYPEGC